MVEETTQSNPETAEDHPIIKAAKERMEIQDREEWFLIKRKKK